MLVRESRVKKKRLVYICDWLPPDFGAVGQYAMVSAREWATSGWAVTLVGLTSREFSPRGGRTHQGGDARDHSDTAALRVTRFWRRRIHMFEVLGLDQARRLVESGIPEERIQLKRNPSPVLFSPGLRPLPLPDALRDGSGVILYSGNWGVAHDDDTFIEAYSEYFRQSRHGLKFWLNAVGSKADRVEGELRRRAVFVYVPYHYQFRFEHAAASPNCGRRAPDHLARCFCRLCSSLEGACLYRIRKEDNFYWQRAFRRSFAGERCAVGPGISSS